MKLIWLSRDLSAPQPQLPPGWPSHDHEEADADMAAEKIESGYYAPADALDLVEPPIPVAPPNEPFPLADALSGPAADEAMIDPHAAGSVGPGEIEDPAAYEQAKAEGRVGELPADDRRVVPEFGDQAQAAYETMPGAETILSQKQPGSDSAPADEAEVPEPSEEPDAGAHEPATPRKSGKK